MKFLTQEENRPNVPRVNCKGNKALNEVVNTFL